jgi:DNA helicase-2/ATP-dependent DNA helicase PcrA
MALGSAAGLAEERRLFYVATTRARDRLTLYTPLRMPYNRRSRNDRHGLAPASRFLEGEVLSALDIQEDTPSRPRVAAGVAAHATITVDLDHLWR